MLYIMQNFLHFNNDSLLIEFFYEFNTFDNHLLIIFLAYPYQCNSIS